MSDCPFHKMLRHLKVFSGLPVPDSAKWIDGKPDFRQIDEAKMLHHWRFKLCAVCGRRLGFQCFWIGGGRSAASHLFTDFAMHKECAEESARLCPFLNGSRQHYRGELPTVEEHKASVAEGRPKVQYILRGTTASMEIRELPSGGCAYHAGENLTVHSQF